MTKDQEACWPEEDSEQDWSLLQTVSLEKTLVIVSEFVCLYGKKRNDLWFPCVAFLVSMVWLFVPCPRSQLSLSLAENFKSLGLHKLWKSVNRGVYADVYSVLQCCGVFSFVFLVMSREAAS